MKRLGERGGGNFLLLKIIGEGEGRIFYMCTTLSATKKSVSYTHLDVYKRQTIESYKSTASIIILCKFSINI